MSTCCYSLRFLSKFCDKKTLINVYHANFHSIMRFGIIFWGSGLSVERLFIIQKYAIRIICKIGRLVSCREYFKSLNIMTIFDTYIYEVSCFVFKNRAMFSENRITHNYNTRYKETLIPHAHTSTLYQKNFFYNGCKIYNKLPASIRTLTNLIQFKKAVKKYLIEQGAYNFDEFMSRKS